MGINDITLSKGVCGDILILLNLFLDSKDQTILLYIKRLLNVIISNGIEFGDLSSGLWVGPFGLLYVLDLLNRNFPYDNEFYILNKGLCEKMTPYLYNRLCRVFRRRKDYDLDYIFGLSGLFFVIREHSILSADNKIINKSTSIIRDILTEGIGKWFVRTQSKDSFYYNKLLAGKSYMILGYAHGVAGMLSQINLWQDRFESIEDRILEDNNAFIERLLSQIADSGALCKGGAEFIILEGGENPLEYLEPNFSWCYGSVGVGNYLHLIRKKEWYTFVETALVKHLCEIFSREIIISKVDPCICHGISGIIYYLWVYEKNISKVMLKDMIECLRATMLHTKMDNFEFLDGLGGSLLVLNAISSGNRFVGDELFGFR